MFKKITAFTLAEVLIAKRERGKMSLLNLARTRELKAPSSKFLKQCAFTLSEVLITLGIIGIVAAMTIPSLMQKYQEHQYKVDYKKAYSEISRVFSGVIVENNINPRTTKFDSLATAEEFALLKSNFNIVKDCTRPQLAQCWAVGEDFMNYGPGVGDAYSFIDSSGRSWAQFSSNENLYLVDTNGQRLPNKYGKDRWTFTLRDLSNKRIEVGLPVKVTPYSGSDTTVNDINSATIYCHFPPCYYKTWLYN